MIITKVGKKSKTKDVYMHDAPFAILIIKETTNYNTTMIIREKNLRNHGQWKT